MKPRQDPCRQSRALGIAMVVFASVGGPAAAQCEPPLLGSLDRDWSVQDVAVEGTLCALAAGASYSGGGLKLIDVSDPPAPILLASYSTDDETRGVFLDPPFAYVVNGPDYQALHIVDVSDPSAPLTLSTMPQNGGDAFDVHVVQGLAYVADGPAGLWIIDVADPIEPRHVARVSAAGIANSVYVLDGLAFVTGSEGFQIIDISTPTSPTLAGFLALTSPQDVVVSGHVAYIADGGSGLRIVDVSDPMQPALAATVSPPQGTGYAEAVEIHDGIALVGYGGDHISDLQSVDVRVSQWPVCIGSSAMSGSVHAIDIASALVYVGTWGDALEIRGLPPCSACPANINGDCSVDTRDVTTFLNLWVAGDPRADHNSDGTINTLDVLAYLNDWVAGC